MSWVLTGLAGNFVTYVAKLPALNVRTFSMTPHMSQALVYEDLKIAKEDAKEFEMEVIPFVQEEIIVKDFVLKE